MYQKLLIFFCILFFAVRFTYVSPVSAASNFTTDYHVTYSIPEAGKTHAVLTVTLTNTTSDYYASSYKLQIGFNDISNVQAYDPGGAITPNVTKVADGYTIELPFNKKSVGLGNSLQFNLSFDTPSVAKKYGEIWEINIPGLSQTNEFNTFTVDVKTPPSFGTPSYIKPDQQTKSLTFTKDQLGNSGISIAFGTKQIYTFHLVYHLQNSNVYPIKTEIALPPTTNYQKVSVSDINPRPSNVTIDKDGNWLAQYSLKPSQKTDVTVNGNAEVSLTPSQQPLAQSDFSQYLSEQRYWEAKNDKIRELADTLRTPQAIYLYVIKTLKYDFSRVTDDKPRLGAVGALKNQNSAVCREFTDLFIALARAAGIPAREVDGFAYTENEKERPLSLVRDILHAWPEYYDSGKKTWVMVDPTWGSTTGGVDYFNVLDFDHFAFVIKGMESDYPIPAGGYKLANEKELKDVTVTFGDTAPDPLPDMEITDFPKEVIAGFPIRGKLTISNNGSTYIQPQIIYLTSTVLTPQDQSIASSGIPPFGHVDLPVGFDRTSFLTNTDSAITIRLGQVQSGLDDQTYNKTIKITPVFYTAWGIGGIIIGLFAVFLFIIARKSRRIYVSR